jgi:hypothetical protein
MKKTSFAVAAQFVAVMASMVFADDAKKMTEGRGEKPKASPGWVVVEEDWCFPFLYDFSSTLHNARDYYRAKEEKSASAEIDKAISWLKYAIGDAEISTAEDLSTARTDVMDFSASLKSGKPVLAKKLDSAFAHASEALARHHYFKSSKALAEGDLKTSGRHLMAAADLLRSTARFGNVEYGSDAVGIYDDYAPYGYWDETIAFEKNKVESNLATVKTELEQLAAKLKASR